MELILASASPRRSDLLRAWGIPFRAVPAEGLDEDAVRGEAPHVAGRLAEMKAAWTLRLLAPADSPAGLLVLGADTVVEIDGEILVKPRDRADARRMLEALSGRVHRVHWWPRRPGRPGDLPGAHRGGDVGGGVPPSRAATSTYIDTGDAEEGGRLRHPVRGRRLSPLPRLLLQHRRLGSVAASAAGLSVPASSATAPITR
jgi:hypothetical protein